MEKAKQFGCLTENCTIDTWKAYETMKVDSGPNDTCFASIGLGESDVSTYVK